MSDDPKAGQPGDRLAKVIARAGLCSRRDAEDWIRGGRVSVNGTVVRTPAFNVTDTDRITVDGEPLASRRGTRVWLYHKPPGLVVTEKDPEGRPTIFEALAVEGLPRVMTVGRLDINTEGLLLLTNDGGLKRVLELPSTGWLRRYRVRAFGAVTQEQLDVLREGIELDGVKYGPIEATLERQQGSNVWLLVALREGKNREVKNVLGALGLQVNRLIRVSYGPFQLGDLPVGGVEVVRSRVLRDQLGKKLAAEAGVDFESELPEPAALARPPRPQPQPQRERAMPPGRPRGGRRPAEPAPASRPAGRVRRIFFDDGRPPEEVAPPPEPRRSGPSRPGRPDRPDQPGRSGPPEPRRSARSGPPERPGPGRPGRPSRPDQPGRPGRPDRPDQPGRPSRPGRPGQRGATSRDRSGGPRRPGPGGGGKPPRKPRG